MANTSSFLPLSPRARDLNPGTSSFHPGTGNELCLDPLISDIVDRVKALELGQGVLLDRLDHIDSERAVLSRTVMDLENGTKARNNMHYPQGLDGPADTAYVPPHLRSASVSSNGTVTVPPHLRKNFASLAIKDEKAEYAALFDGEPAKVGPTSPPTPPNEPDMPRPSIEQPHSDRWTPLFVTQMPKLDPKILAMVPPLTEIVTFSFDFLTNTFGGSFWTPGLKYIPPPAVCMLPTRSYWLMDGSVEPYLPQEPAQHGAKITAFYNPHDPADDFGTQATGSFDNVPMFVCNTPLSVGNARRYVYMGNYSQTRWSDKLDYDRMVQHVPDNVKEYWAEELSAAGRPEWVTEKLKKHFFPMPPYEGRFPREQGEGSVATVEEDEKVMEDMKEYLGDLKEWDEEASLKTTLIKKGFILQAFERVCCFGFFLLSSFCLCFYSSSFLPSS